MYFLVILKATFFPMNSYAFKEKRNTIYFLLASRKYNFDTIINNKCTFSVFKQHSSDPVKLSNGIIIDQRVFK